jgi:hypothetical protein
MRDDEPVISLRTGIGIACLCLGALIDWLMFHNQPPLRFLFALFCLFIVLDALDGIRNLIKRLETKLDTVLEKVKGDQ